MVASAGQRGVTYLALLIAVALVSGVLAASATVISHAQRRERERQLLWAGDQIRRAIVAYSKQPAAGVDGGAYPADLAELLEDKRLPFRHRYLRRIYHDPMTNSTDWGLIRNAQRGITGVFSRSELAPIKTGNFPGHYRSFEQAETYADWKFAASNEVPARAANQARPAPVPSSPNTQPAPGE